jgi:16S rRNA (guanine(527)-N(7))-methyltransferase RsmG
MSSNIEELVGNIFIKEDISIQRTISKYMKLLFKWHETNNIVSSSNIDYVIKREIYDSYQFNNALSGNSFSDIGTGGGIPGIIMAILKPNMRVDLIDRKTTFINFLSLVKAELRLENVTVIKKDVLGPDIFFDTDTVVMKNFSNKKISKMEFEEKFSFMMNIIKNNGTASKAYMLTGSPVLELSEECVSKFSLSVTKISSPFFTTSRYIAEVRFEDTIDS